MAGMRLAAIPSVDRILSDPRLVAAVAQHGRPLVVAELRVLLEEYRSALKLGSALPMSDEGTVLGVLKRLEFCVRPSLRRVFNLTGTVLHTNLGRALLPREAVDAAAQVMGQPSNLEYDLDSGRRGDRDAHVEAWLTRLTGAEAATVVNNNAAAVFLVLNTLP